MFYLQLADNTMQTFDEASRGLKSFHQLVEINSERILVLRASSQIERQIWVEIIGSIIYLQLIRKIELSNKSLVGNIGFN
jgi:hypothetical protein